jgi:hypothetical protein
VEGDEGLPTAIIFIEEQRVPLGVPTHQFSAFNLLLKGTGSQDEIPIFWQKWFYWFLNF